MNSLLENCLYKKDPDRFEKLRKIASKFHKDFIGDIVVRDGIFESIKIFADVNNQPLKILKFPINDKNLWAFTCVKNGIIFVTINTKLPYSYQIFAAAHELYHIYKYILKSNNDILENVSALTENTVDDINVSEEDREANAFAALILAPKKQIELREKMATRKLSESDISDLIHFMDYFAMPYKAMVLKLFECEHYSETQADILLNTEFEQIFEDARLHGCTKWLLPTNENNLDSLKLLIELNQKADNITESKAVEDILSLDNIEKKLQKLV